MRNFLNSLLNYIGFHKTVSPHAIDKEGYPIGKFSILLNDNENIIYTNRKLALQGLYIRGNPDGSEDIVKKTPSGYEVVSSFCGKGKGKFAYLISKASRRGDYEYLRMIKLLEEKNEKSR